MAIGGGGRGGVFPGVGCVSAYGGVCHTPPPVDRQMPVKILKHCPIWAVRSKLSPKSRQYLDKIFYDLHWPFNSIKVPCLFEGAEVICAETSAVRMADKPVKTKDTEITCGPSTNVLVADQLSHHFIFYLRLYLLGTYKEPKKKELEADAGKNNTEKRAQSKTGNTQKPANQHNSSTCIIL